VCRLVCEREPLSTVRPLDRETYTPGGGTPLLDAMGRTIMWMDLLKPQPERILVVILTDGAENASREFTRPQIQDLIRSREATSSWTFVYLGANQDAWAAGEALGIARGNRAGFEVGETRQTRRLPAAPSSSRRRRSFPGTRCGTT
jgi:Mg-chelatase subunit ChlD